MFFAHGHLGEPLAALDRQHHGAILVHDVHRAEGPAVHLEGFAVLLGGVAVAFIIGVGFHNVGVGQVVFNQRLHPGAGDDVGTVLFAGVRLDRHLAGQAAPDLLKRLAQALGGKVPGEVHHGLLAGALLHRDVMFAARAGLLNRFTHKKRLLACNTLQTLWCCNGLHRDRAARSTHASCCHCKP